MEWDPPASYRKHTTKEQGVVNTALVAYRKHTTKEQGVVNTALVAYSSEHRNRCGIGRIVHTTLQTAMDGVLGSETLKPGIAWL